MIESSIPEINLDEIMQMIRDEIRNRKQKISISAQKTSDPEASVPLRAARMDLPEMARSPQADTFKVEKKYHINDLVKYRDRDFVLAAYRAVLRRQPDSGGLDHFLNNLRSGKMTKAEILGRLRYSPEGKRKQTIIKGLFWNFVIQSSFRVPVVGYLSRFVFGVANLPLILNNLRVFEERAATRLDRQGDGIGILRTKMEELASVMGTHESRLSGVLSRPEVDELMDKLRNELSTKASEESLTTLDHELRTELSAKISQEAFATLDQELRTELSAKASQESLATVSEKFDSALNDKDVTIQDILRQIKDHKRNILDQQRRLALLLEEARKRMPKPISREQLEKMVSEENQMLNAMYVSFEDQFRGTREDIKERQRVYLPYIEAVDAGSKEYPILDVGCGRGEWLELLQDVGFRARGVDINAWMLDECMQRSLDVIHGDGINYLRGLKDSSLGAITGFQIIEHFSTKTAVCLIDEALRVIKPGGIVIFETPNPENVLVGSCTFYSDPSHKNPIPPETLKFLIEYRGFLAIEILRLHPLNFMPNGSDDTFKDLVYRFNMGQDYAVIARKP